MTKKLFSFLLRGALALMLSGTCIAAPAFADEALAKLSVGADPDFRPISFMGPDGALQGYDVDFATALAKHMGVPLNYEGMAWDGIIPALQADKINAITNIAITDARKAVVDFSQPIMKQSIIAVVKADSPNQSVSPDDLKKAKIGVMTGTSAAEALAAMPDLSPTTYNTVIDAYNDLLLGRIDVVAVESVNGSYLVESQFKGKLVVTSEPLTSSVTLNGVALRKGSDKPLAQVNEAINKMKADGTLKDISRKWFGNDTNVPE
ncbi:amino acid ABC transporter substrate-binding protein [Mesorhizobium sp. B2-4-19]|uniref:ABC transporter substrate-binding protein n=1 Tax=Mesorhizobium sp. B2-4-19 TaxID=2589930 RepID=UPI00112D3B93|nr:ABC transporter substrate-binding protein [Mesorhizobium sp. B2-4-19]TPK60121.1 amino acid ABC transporter substrate-binding protein [Mesorhizobium sp. B2-4-19]